MHSPTRKAIYGMAAGAGLALTVHAAQAAPCINTTTILPPAFGQGAGAGCALVATNTTVNAVFAFQSALDTDTLLFDGAASNPIISNKTTALGTEIVLNTTIGQTLRFIFNDISSSAFANTANGGPAGFTGAVTAAPAAPGGAAASEGYLNADPASAADAIAHTAYANLTTGTGPVTSASASLFCDDPGTGSGGCAAASPPRPDAVLSSAVVSAMNGIDSNSADWLLVGFEDRLNMISGFPQTDEDFNDLIFAFRNTAAVLVPEPASLPLIGSAIVGFGVIRRRRNAS